MESSWMLLWQSSRQGFANSVAMDQVRFERGSWMLISLTSETDKRSATSTSPDTPWYLPRRRTLRSEGRSVREEARAAASGRESASGTGAWGWLQATAPMLCYFMVRVSPRGDILYLGFTEGAALRQLVDAGHGCSPVNGGLSHDVRQNLMEEGNNMAVDLLKLQQEGIVALGAVNALQPRVRDASGDLLLFGEGEETV